MDESETYIKMAVQAWPYLSAELAEDTDFLNYGYCTRHKQLLTGDQDGCPTCIGFQEQVTALGFDEEKVLALYHSDDHCCMTQWVGLPRQDQLQGLIGGWDMDAHGHVGTLAGLLRFSDTDLYIWRDIGSWEQLWLCFVMYQKFGLMWAETWEQVPKKSVEGKLLPPEIVAEIRGGN